MLTMPDPQEWEQKRIRSLTIQVQADPEALLAGLMTWQQMGLISHDQVRELCRDHLACPLPQGAGVSIQSGADPGSQRSVLVAYLLWGLGLVGLCGIHRIYSGRVVTGLVWFFTFGFLFVGQLIDVFLIPWMIRGANGQSVVSSASLLSGSSLVVTSGSLAELAVRSDPGVIEPARRVSPPQVSRIARWAKALRDELSVRWLLFLGAFLVVVSSAVLASSQWQRFTPSGQYGVLLAYTLALAGVAVWTERLGQVPLTQQTVRWLGLLLIPINFWAMDGLLRPDPWVQRWLVRVVAAALLMGMAWILIRNQRAYVANGVALGLLNWGWAIAGYPVVAVYLGILGTVGHLGYRSRKLADPPDPVLSVGLGYACLLLLIRAVTKAEVPIYQMGLAVGGIGALLAGLADPKWRRWLGLGLLLLGWGVAVTDPVPGQAVILSGVGIGLGWRQLERSGRIRDLLLLATWMVPVGWLIARILPSVWQSAIVIRFGAVGDPWTLAGIFGLAYVWALLGIAWKEQQRERLKLSQVAEILALAAAGYLTLVSLWNPTVRFVNLLLTTLTLGWILRQQHTQLLIYLTHSAGLLTVLSGLWLLFPQPNWAIWSGILLMLMIMEWAFCVGEDRIRWRQSAWFIGLGLAGVSGSLIAYEILNRVNNWLFTTSIFFGELPAYTPFEWGWIWLAAPAMLTTLAQSSRFRYQNNSKRLAVVSVIVLQCLTFETEAGRLIGLGSGLLLMLINVRQLPTLPCTLLTVGSGVGFLIATLHQVVRELSWEVCLVEVGILLWMLWGLRHWIGQWSTELAQNYRRSLDSWAIGMAGLGQLSLIWLIFYYWLIRNNSLGFTDSQAAISGMFMILGAIVYRNWQGITNLGITGLACIVELGLILVARVGLEDPTYILAVANLGLGIGIALFADRWLRTRQTFLWNWVSIPLIFAGLGCSFGHAQTEINPSLFSLGLVFITLAVSRYAQVRVLGSVALVGFSFTAHEALWFELSKSSGGKWGDGLLIFAALNLALALIYRLLLPRIQRRLQLADPKWLPMVHWGLSSFLIALAPGLEISTTGSDMMIGLLLGLATYAIWQGRTLSLWIYFGVASLAFAGWELSIHLPSSSLFLVVSSCLLGFACYRLPWSRWGWDSDPWRNSALVLPGVAIILSIFEISTLELLLAAIYYGLLSYTLKQVRLSYISVGLLIWSGLLLLVQTTSSELWYAAPFCLALLYLAQVDPGLKQPKDRDTRHWIRILAVGLFCLLSFSEARGQFLPQLAVIGLGLLWIVAGLGLRIRAYLYVGTLTFIAVVLDQGWRFISSYSFLLWALGILVGMAMIWIAASFETRREQFGSVVSRRLADLKQWQ